jgi:glycosyltransferase involved in cell wall biosynthesis
MPAFRRQQGAYYFAGHYNIGVWYWELSRFPERLWPSFEGFQEIWVTSAFCAEAIGKASPVPVVKMTQPIVLDESLIRPGREQFNLPAEPYVFLTYFDYRSIWERKNPLAVVRAFRKAFGRSKDALLVVKSINADFDPDNAYLLEQAAEGLNVRFIDGHLERTGLLSLFATSDCLVSLHRSEGLGLGIAEAMYLGKPVIATSYSGNMDFMDVGNSFPVHYDLIELKKDYGPYEAGNSWAEPDSNHAAQCMRHVFENREDARHIGERGAQDIRARMNPVISGQEIRARLLRRVGA